MYHLLVHCLYHELQGKTINVLCAVFVLLLPVLQNRFLFLGISIFIFSHGSP